MHTHTYTGEPGGSGTGLKERRYGSKGGGSKPRAMTEESASV